MAYEREHRLDDRALASRPDELEDSDIEFGVPGKQTQIELLDRIAAIGPAPIASRSHVNPGRQPVLAAKPAFHDFQALALRDVLSRLGPRRALRDATLAAADPKVARRVAERALGGARPADHSRASPEGRGLWRAAERRAVTLYRRATATGIGAPETKPVAEAIGAIGSGVPLPTDVRRKLEVALRVSLEGVRLHTGSVARDAAGAVNAEAFTVGEDIFFPAYDPMSSRCQETLAHEVVHCIQWRQGRIGAAAGGPAVSRPDDPLEREAEHTAKSIVMHAFQAPPNVARATAPRQAAPSVDRRPTAVPAAIMIGPVSPGVGVAAAPGSGRMVMRRERVEGQAQDELPLEVSAWGIPQRIDDLVYSVAQARAHIPAVGGEYVEILQENWEWIALGIAGSMATYKAADWGSKKLIASGNPRKMIAGGIIQLLLKGARLAAIATPAASSLMAFSDHVDNWARLGWNACGDPEQIDKAGEAFARAVASLLAAAAALLGGVVAGTVLSWIKVIFGKIPKPAFSTQAGSTALAAEGTPSTALVAQTRTLAPPKHGAMAPAAGYFTVGSTLADAVEPDDEPLAGLPAPDEKFNRRPRNPGVIIRYENGEVARVNALGELNTTRALRNLGNGLPGYTDVAFHGDPFYIAAMRRGPARRDVDAQAPRDNVEAAGAKPTVPIIHGRSVRDDSGVEKWSAEHLADVLKRMHVKGPIRLISCSTGAVADGFASALARELKVVVLARAEAVTIGDEGVASEHGWFKFEPSEDGEPPTRSLLLQTWQDRTQLAYYERFLRPLSEAPNQIVLESGAIAPAVKAPSYQEDMRLIRNLVGGDLGLFVEQHGQHRLILQRTARTGSPLIAPPGTRELYRVTAGKAPPKVSKKVDQTIKKYISAATSSIQKGMRRAAEPVARPRLRVWQDTNAAQKELQRIFRRHFEVGTAMREGARNELLTKVRQLLLEVGLSESTWPALAKLNDEKLRSLTEPTDFLAGIASMNRKLHSIVEWLADAYAADRITLEDFHFHLAQADELARLPEVVILPTEPGIDRHTVSFQARHDNKDITVTVPRGYEGHAPSARSPRAPSGTRVRYFDTNLRIWREGLAAGTVAERPSETAARTPSIDQNRQISLSAPEPNIQDVRRNLQQCFLAYYANPTPNEYARLLDRIRQRLTDELHVSDTLWENLQALHHSKLSTLVNSKDFLMGVSSTDQKLRSHVELIAKAYASSASNGMSAKECEYYLQHAEEISHLDEVTDLVVFDRGQGSRGMVFRGHLEGNEVLAKVPISGPGYGLVGSGLLKIDSLKPYEGPRWGRRVRVLAPKLGVYIEALAMEIAPNGYSIRTLKELSTQGKELPFRVTPKYREALIALQQRIDRDHAYLQDVHPGNVLLTPNESRPIVLVDMMVLHGTKGLDGDVGDLSDVLPDLIALEQYRQ